MHLFGHLDGKVFLQPVGGLKHDGRVDVDGSMVTDRAFLLDFLRREISERAALPLVGKGDALVS